MKMKKKKILEMACDIFSDLMRIQHPEECDPLGSVMYNSCCCNLCTALSSLDILKAGLSSELLEKEKMRTIREIPKIEVVLCGALGDLLDQLDGIGIPDWKGAEGLDLTIAKRALKEYGKQKGRSR